eukprot:Skav218290  [mRNA]  locus=scaffold2035:819838:823675:- [translate_table: standard]
MASQSGLNFGQPLPSNVRAYTAVIRSYGQGRQWPAAVSLLAALKTETLEADLIVYNAAMSACSRASAWEMVLALFESLELARLQSDLITYSICISACAKADEWRHALQLLRCLEDGESWLSLVHTGPSTMEEKPKNKQGTARA